MIIGSNRKLAGISSFSLSIFDTDINSVTSFKYLGVILSSTFTWSDHVEYISSRLIRTLVFYVGLSIIYLIMPGYFFITV